MCQAVHKALLSVASVNPHTNPMRYVRIPTLWIRNLSLGDVNQLAQSHKVHKSQKIFEPFPLCPLNYLSDPGSVFHKKFILNAHVPCFVLVPVRKGVS